MSLITLIDNIPLYTTIREANVWGSQYNITGYHTHVYNSVTGYMSGDNHEIITRQVTKGIQNFLTPKQLASGRFVVTSEAVRAYYKNQRDNSNVPQSANQFRRINNIVAQPVTPRPVVQQQQQVTPAYIPPSTSGGSSGGSSGGGY